MKTLAVMLALMTASCLARVDDPSARADAATDAPEVPDAAPDAPDAPDAAASTTVQCSHDSAHPMIGYCSGEPCDECEGRAGVPTQCATAFRIGFCQ